MRTDVRFNSNRNTVYFCKYHVVWCPKYQRSVLLDGMDARLKGILHQTTTELQAEIIELEGEWLDAGRAQQAWPGADLLLQAALSDVVSQPNHKQPVNGRRLPSSSGLSRGQRQNRSPVKASVNPGKAPDAVPHPASGGEPGKAWRIARTPRL